MAGKWSGGVVESMAGVEPPSVAEWSPVPDSGPAGRFVDAEGPIAYRRTVPDPRRSATDRAILELRGVVGRARAWVNGRFLGNHDSPFEPAQFEFLPEEENEVLIACEPSASSAAIERLPGVPDERAVPGVWRGVSVESRPATFLRDLEVRPELSDDRASLSVALDVDAGEPVDDAVTFSVRPDGFRGGGSMERASVQAAAGERVRVEKRIEVRDPTLWWPRELGPPHRYTLRAKLGELAVERRVGLRRVERDEDGFVVNGRRVRARGFTVLPGTADPGLVERAAAANATVLRFPGHVPSRTVYEACDEAGILVWQGLPEPGDLDVERAVATGERLLDRYGRHPSLAALGVREVGPEPFDRPLGSGVRAKLALRWRAWRVDDDRSAADEVAASLPSTAAVIPVTGPPGTGADAWTIAPGWSYLEAADVDWLLDRYPAIGTAVAGFGAATVRDPDGSIGERDDAALRARGLDVDSSRLHQVAVLKAVAEALRRRRCGIVVADALADPSPAGGRGVIDADGAPKPAYDAIAASFEPVQAVVAGRPIAGDDASVWVVNDASDAVEATVAWRAGVAEGTLSATVDPSGAAEAGTVPVPRGAEELVLELSDGDREARNRYPL